MKLSNRACSLSISVSRADVPFIMYTIPHMVRMCNHDFLERCLIIDTAPLSGEFESRPGVGSLSELRRCCEKLLREGVVDRLIDIDYSKEMVKRLYLKHFGKNIKFTYDFRGTSNYGSIFGMEAVKGDYVLHFDSDMLLYQKPGFSWIEAGMRLHDEDDRVMFVSPLSGPPTRDGSLKQRDVRYEFDEAGFYRFQDLTSRKYLLKKEKMNSFLPMEPVYVSRKRRLAALVTHKSPVWNWEIIVSEHLKKTGTLRADMVSSDAWTLHTPDHGEQFVRSLPQIVAKVEAGSYPGEQAGDYDLNLSLWLT